MVIHTNQQATIVQKEHNSNDLGLKEWSDTRLLEHRTELGKH